MEISYFPSGHPIFPSPFETVPQFVIPANAGVQDANKGIKSKLDSGLRRNDGPLSGLRHSPFQGEGEGGGDKKVKSSIPLTPAIYREGREVSDGN
jgi:hypothetical protein